MAVIAAVALGLNPYVGAFVLAALAAFTNHVPADAPLARIPAPALALIAMLAGLAIPIDLVLSKFIRFAPCLRRVSHVVAPAGGAFLAGGLTTTLPTPVMAVVGAVIAWAVAALLTSAAARASRSPAWVGLGHIPVLMAAATTAACLVPLALARLGLGLVPAVAAVVVLLASSITAWQTRAHRVRAHRRTLASGT